MNGLNLFLKKDGSALQDQFWAENVVPTSSGTGNTGVRTNGQTHNGYQLNSCPQQGPVRSQAAGYASVPYNQLQQSAMQYSPMPLPPSIMAHGGAVMIGSGSSNPSSPQQSKKRVARACDHCRRRKIKCDPVNPQTNKCSNCTKYDANCTFRVRDDVEKRKRANEAIDGSGGVSEDLNILGFVPTPGVGQNGDEYHAGNMERFESMPFVPKCNERKADLSGKVEKLDKKVSVIADNLTKMRWMLERLVQGNEVISQPDNRLKSKPKQYSTTLLTPRILNWADKKLQTHQTENSIIAPIRELLTTTTKWHLLQMKAVTDFSVPFFKDGKYCLHPIPPRIQAKRIVESFRSAMLVASAPAIIMADYYSSLIDEYYTSECLSYAELLLVNASICFSASRMSVMNSSDSYRLRKDRYDPSKEELRKIEHDTLLNAIYYYNRVSVGGPSVTGVQGLLLLSVYLQETLDTELAYATHSTAVRFAVDLGLNQISSYVNLTMEEEVLRRSLWWLCCNCDKVFAVFLSRLTLIKDQDMDMLSDENYFEFAKRTLELKKPKFKDEIRKLPNLESCLSYMVDFCDFLPMHMSYFILKLIRFEEKIIENCFTVRSTVNCSFDNTIDRVLVLREDLDNWAKTLHPSMQLSSYKNYISLLYVRDGVDNPALTFETACSRVLRSHFRCMHARIVLSMFAVAFIVDNAAQSIGSRHQITSIHRLFVDDQVEYCVQMLKLFQMVDYERHLYNALLFSLLTGVFTLILYAIKNIDDEPNERMTEIIQLLIATHSHLVGDNAEYLVSDNYKWNTSVFFYTILLTRLLQSYNARHSRNKKPAFKLGIYDGMLEKIMRHADKLKNDSIDRMVSYMRDFNLTEGQSKVNFVEPSSHFFPLSQNSVPGIRDSTLRFFRSSEPFEILPTPSRGHKNLDEQVHQEESLFRTEGLSLSEYSDTFNPEAFAEELIGPDTIFSTVDVSGQNYEELQDSFYPYALFYDRDTRFSHVLADRLGQPRG